MVIGDYLLENLLITANFHYLCKYLNIHVVLVRAVEATVSVLLLIHAVHHNEQLGHPGLNFL